VHHYRKNIGDYAKKAGRLSILQHGVYNLLMDACYDREKFPTRDEAIDWVWASTPEEIDAVDFVLSKFFYPHEDGQYIQRRIEDELEEYRKFCKLQAEKGRKGGRPKNPAGKNKNPVGSEGKPMESRVKAGKSLTTNHQPLTSNHLKEKDKKEIANRVISKLNDLAGKRFRFTEHNQGLVIARISEGFTEADCLQVVANRCQRWLGTEQSEYLRPDTLFRPSKFEGYLNDNGGTNAKIRHDGNTSQNGRKPTPAEQTAELREQARQRESTTRPSTLGSVASDGADIWPPVELAARGSTQ